MIEEFVLTDDEVVAIAALSDSFWPGPLPTVEVSAEALERAAFSGSRSLAARGLLGESGGVTDLLAQMTQALVGSRHHAVVYLGDDSSMRASWGIASAHYPRSNGWVLESVSAIGLHQLSVQPMEAHRSYFEAMLSGAMSAEPPADRDPETTPRWLCVAAFHSDGQALLARGRAGELLVGDATATDTGALVCSSGASADPQTAAATLVGFLQP